MRIASKWTPLPLFAVLVSACSELARSEDRGGRRDGESMVALESDEPDGDPSGPPGAGRSCDVGGLTYPDDSSIPSGDRCTRCRCEDGSLVCRAAACEPLVCDLFVEVADGVCSRSPLDPCTFQDPDCGNPSGGGADAGTEADAGSGAEPQAKACEVAGQRFPDQSDVPSGDDCNSCGCDDGAVVCTEVACDPVFCAEFLEEADGVCARFPLDPCISQDPDCGAPPVAPEP